MSKNWLYVIIAGLVEILWVTGLKYSERWYEWAGTILIICFSFYLLVLATKQLPVATAYAIFAGLGTAGTTIVGMVVFGDEFSWLKILLIVILLVGILGLKLVTNEEESVA